MPNESVRLQSEIVRAEAHNIRLINEQNNRLLTLQKVRNSMNELITFFARLQDITKHHESWMYWDYYKRLKPEIESLIRYCEGARADIKRLQESMPE